MILEHKRLDLYGKILFEKAIVTAPFSLARPMPDEACFIYIIKGENHSVSEVEKICAGAKEALLMKCGSYFAEMFSSKPNGTYEAVAVHFYPEILKKVYEKEMPSFLKSSNKSTETSMVKFKTDELLQKYFDSILFYFSNPDLVNEELMVLKLKELFLLLEKTSNAPQVKDLLSSLFSPKAFTFKEIITAHLFSNISLEQLAQLTNCSLSSFKREFKKIFNDTPARYIRNKKLEKATELLQITNLNITEITFECGFNDLAVFSKCFKEKYDTTPSDYRKQVIKN